MWISDGSLAHLQTDRLTAQVLLRQPELGLHAVLLRGQLESAELREHRLMGLKLPGGTELEELHDNWVRGSDLVVVYAATARRPSQPEIYWRCLTSADSIGIELIASVKTQSLDDFPEISVTSELDAVEVWWVPDVCSEKTARRILAEVPASEDSGSDAVSVEEPGSFVVRLPGNVSYIQMTHPTDFCTAKLSRVDHRVCIQSPLFPENLEKGVIRRGRMRGWFVRSEADIARAQRLFEEFTRSELPLTT